MVGAQRANSTKYFQLGGEERATLVSALSGLNGLDIAIKDTPSTVFFINSRLKFLNCDQYLLYDSI